MNTTLTQQGLITAAFGRHYLVELNDGEILECVPRGKKSEVACGDRVEIQRSSADQGVIERTLPRSSLLYRSDAYRQKIIAANVSQIICVVAVEPSFNDELLARCLIAAHDQQLETLIVLNKCDLPADAARATLAPYRAIGYRVLEISAQQNSAPLLPFLQGHTSVLVGQSGMGKSTLINGLLPDAKAATREISTVLDSGKHTTTHARLYHLNGHVKCATPDNETCHDRFPHLNPDGTTSHSTKPTNGQVAGYLPQAGEEANESLREFHLSANSNLIDCPGVQMFGLHHLSLGEIESGFVEFAQYLGQCRFHNCSHTHEPNCALLNAVAAGKIDARRMKLFQDISRPVRDIHGR